jgi:hypothetical protein
MAALARRSARHRKPAISRLASVRCAIHPSPKTTPARSPSAPPPRQAVANAPTTSARKAPPRSDAHRPSFVQRDVHPDAQHQHREPRVAEKGQRRASRAQNVEASATNDDCDDLAHDRGTAPPPAEEITGPTRPQTPISARVPRLIPALTRPARPTPGSRAPGRQPARSVAPKQSTRGSGPSAPCARAPMAPSPRRSRRRTSPAFVTSSVTPA